MYRDSKEYTKLDKAAFSIVEDYGIKAYPLDIHNLCSKMGICLKGYSEYGIENQYLLIKKSSKGFFVRESKELPPSIFYNDYGISFEEQRITIAHEIKHYIFNEDNTEDRYDDLADHFGRFLLCPTPYLMVTGITDASDISEHCIVSISAAKNAASNIENRIAKYGYHIFDYEKSFLEQLIPNEFEQFQKRNNKRRWSP